MKLLFVLLIAASTTAHAFPIPNNAFAMKKVGWWPSAAVPCPNICAAKASPAEREGFSMPGVGISVTYSCKARAQIAGGFGWLYGNNFNSPNYQRYCFVSTPAGQVLRMNNFMCLCSN